MYICHRTDNIVCLQFEILKFYKMETLRRRFIEKYNRTDISTIRSFYNTIQWKDRLIGIKGQRGVGKTTLILQYIKKNLKLDHTTLYASLDHIFFSNSSLYNLAEDFLAKGGKYLFLDEIHRYKNWGQELKNIYDDFPELKVVFTGSSMLHIRKANADLSRRAVIYEMPGLSFREFINFETGKNFKIISFEKILSNHTSISSNIIKHIKPLAFFQQYLQYGFYPFYLENKETFYQRLNEILNVVLEVDIPQFEEIQVKYIEKLKQLLYIISISVPFKPNFQKLAERTGISVNTLKSYLLYLEEARIIHQLKQEGKGTNLLKKLEKIYLNNTNTMFTLSKNQPEKGSLRETFFANQVSAIETVYASKKTDFIVNNKYSFEIGGKNKTKKQIINLENAFVVKDDIEIGFENQIPLWLFGFLY